LEAAESRAGVVAEVAVAVAVKSLPELAVFAVVGVAL